MLITILEEFLYHSLTKTMHTSNNRIPQNHNVNLLYGLFLLFCLPGPCVNLTYIDYAAATSYNYKFDASSNKGDAIQAMQGSGRSWKASLQDSIDENVHFKISLELNEDSPYEAGIQDLYFNIDKTLEVKLEYTFYNFEPTDIYFSPPVAVVNPMHINVAALSLQTLKNVTAVNLVIIPTSATARPSLYDLTVHACFYPTKQESK